MEFVPSIWLCWSLFFPVFDAQGIPPEVCPLLGSNIQTQFFRSTRERLFINFGAPAQCNGTVTTWQYCSYNTYLGDVEDREDYTTKFLVYRQTGPSTYEPVPGSTKTVTISLRSPSDGGFRCRTETLSQSERFAIQQNDIVAACLMDTSSTNPIRIVGFDSSSSLSFVYQYNVNNYEDCTTSQLQTVDTQSSEFTSGSVAYQLHLYAETISPVAQCTGGSNPPPFTPSDISGTYLNTDNPFSCTVTITSWNYCYYPSAANNSQLTYTATIGVWRMNAAMDQYELVPGSDYMVQLVQPPSTPARIFCKTEVLQLVDYVRVQTGDVIGVSLPAQNALPLVASGATGYSLKMHIAQNTPPLIQSVTLMDNSSMALHLYPTIEFIPLPTTEPPTTTAAPTTTLIPTKEVPTTPPPMTEVQTTLPPTTEVPTTPPPTTEVPTTLPPMIEVPTTLPPTTEVPITLPPTTEVPTTLPPTTEVPTTLLPTTEVPTTPPPTTEVPTTPPPTTEVPTTLPPTTEIPTTNAALTTAHFQTTEISTTTRDTVMTPYQTTEESTKAPINTQHTTLGDAITSTEPNLPHATTQDSSTTEQSEVTEEEDLTTHSIHDSQQGIRPEGYISIAMGVLVLILIAIIVVAAGVLCRLYNKTRRKKAHVQDNIGIQSNGLQQVSLSRFTSGHSEHEDANLDVEHDTVIHDDNADVDNTNDEGHMIDYLGVNDSTPGIPTEDNIAYQTSLTTKPNVAYNKVQKSNSNDGTKFIASVSQESYTHNGKEVTADPPDYDYITV